MIVSQDAQKLLQLMQDEYITTGHMYSGSVTLDFVSAKMQWSFEFAASVMDSLVSAGLVQKRNCDAHAFELVPSCRLSLIPDDYRIFNRRRSDGSYRPLAQYFDTVLY